MSKENYKIKLIKDENILEYNIPGLCVNLETNKLTLYHHDKDDIYDYLEYDEPSVNFDYGDTKFKVDDYDIIKIFRDNTEFNVLIKYVLDGTYTSGKRKIFCDIVYVTIAHGMVILYGKDKTISFDKHELSELILL